MSLKVAFNTLGCKVNYYETEALKQQFRKEGFSSVPFDEHADVYVINTCTVTHLADRKSRNMIRRARKKNPDALVVVCGCYPQVEPDAVSTLPDVDLVAGTTQRLLLPELVKKRLQDHQRLVGGVQPYGHKILFEALPWTPEQGRTRAFFKIQDGCDRYCSFCVIPLARGPLRSLPPAQGLAYLHEIIAAGYQEVVLTGIHLGLYGVDLEPPTSLAAFLKEALKLPGLQRLRLSSIEPADFNTELISVIADSNIICPHLHIPLQSGDDIILQKMGRQYNTASFRGLLNELNNALDDLAVSTDIIVGFPGEKDGYFKNSLAFVEECGFSRLHVFPFSPRRGTKAATMTPVVPHRVKKERSNQMLKLNEFLAQNFREKFSGRTMPVLFEKLVNKEEGPGEKGVRDLLLLEGLTPQYLRVRVKSDVDLRGETRNVLLQPTKGEYMQGILQKPPG